MIKTKRVYLATAALVTSIMVGCQVQETPLATTPNPLTTSPGPIPSLNPVPTPSLGPSPIPKANPVSAIPLSYVAIVGVALPISQAAILAANAEQTLKLELQGAPSNSGQVNVSGDSFVFTSNVPGYSSFNYSLSDSLGNVATSTITVRVLTSDKVAGTFYGTDNHGDIYVLENDGSLALALTVSLKGAPLAFNDLAIDSSGTIYGKSYDGGAGTNAIYTVDGKTGDVKVVTPNLIQSVSTCLAGFTFLPDGRIVTALTTSHADGVAGPVSLVAVDLNTQSVTTLVPLSAGYTMYGGDVKYLPDGNLYWTVKNSPGSQCAGNGNQDLVRVNPVSGAVTEVGCMQEAGVYGLGYTFGNVIGFGANGDLLNINLTNAQTKVMNATGKTFAGGASNPVLWSTFPPIGI